MKPKRKNASLNAVNLLGKKILPWGLMALRESDLNS